MFDAFDPNTATKEDMKKLADHIEEYLNNLEDVMIIPDDLIDEYGKQIQEGIMRTKKLIKKLRKGDKSIFRDDLDEESIF